MQIAVCQLWLESEAGWGQRPDGFSLHTTFPQCKAYIKKYWDGMPDGPAPAEYSRPDGEPYLVKVSDRFFEALRKLKGKSCRFWQHEAQAPDRNTKVNEKTVKLPVPKKKARKP